MSASPASILYSSSPMTDFAMGGQPRPKWLLPQQCPIRRKAFQWDVPYSTKFATIGNNGTYDYNTPSTTLGLSSADAILVNYSQPQDLGAAIAVGNATFAIVPESWDDYRWMPVSFVDFNGQYPSTAPSSSILPANIIPRSSFSDIVPVKFTFDYYVVDQNHIISTVANNTPGIATTLKDTAGNAVKVVYKAGDIPSVPKANFGVDWSFGNTRSGNLTNFGGTGVGGNTYYQTLPTKEEYQQMIANADAGGWNTNVWDGTTTGLFPGNILPVAATTDGSGYYTYSSLTVGYTYYLTNYGATSSTWALQSGYAYYIYINYTDGSAFSLTNPSWVPVPNPGWIVQCFKAKQTSLRIFCPAHLSTLIGTNGATKYLQLFYANISSQNYGQYVCEDSHIEPYAGKIIARVTKTCQAL